MNSCSTGTSDQKCTSDSPVVEYCRERYRQDNICIVLLVGIPGSGKSYFRTFFENYFKEHSKTVLGDSKIFSVSYDNFCKVRNPTQFSGDSLRWKEERLEIFKAIEKTIRDLKNFVSSVCDASLNNICVVNSETNTPDAVLFIIDDNMYYRSMRYEYYKLAKSYNLGFCQIFFNATLQDALKYNKQRGPLSQVPDFVIEKMFDKLEPPDKTLSWENNMIALTPYKDFLKDNMFCSILCLIKTALKYPVQQNLESFQREKAKAINNLNAIHQIDITLKHLVGDLIKKRMKESSDNPSKISQYFSEQRLGILKDIKERKIVLPVDLNGPISKQDIDLLKPILLDFLDSSLAL